ncbi:MAG: polyprenyl synthetase family protein [Candidatus Thermoplasmatota archaeon]
MSFIDELKKRKSDVDESVSKIFEEEREHPLWGQMAYYPEAGGKKLRPFLAMVTAGAFGKDEDRALPYGIAIELVHNFTLIHDDIMDKDEKRRGRETLHKKIGEGRAINAGDGLFALAFKILSTTEVEDEKLRMLLKELSTSIVRVAEGQEEDITFEEIYDISEEEFIGMIEKKTSYLFRAATRGGAIIGGGDEKQIEEMGEYARKMGIAFQIQDDYLDLIGEEDTIGKDVGSDIMEGKRTLMVIKSLSELSADDRERLIEILEKDGNNQEEVREAIDLFEKAGAIDYSKELAEGYAEQAKEHLDVIPDGQHKDILKDLVDYIISRNK